MENMVALLEQKKKKKKFRKLVFITLCSAIDLTTRGVVIPAILIVSNKVHKVLIWRKLKKIFFVHHIFFELYVQIENVLTEQT